MYDKLRKSLVSAIAVLTFGVVTPPITHAAQTVKPDNENTDAQSENHNDAVGTQDLRIGKHNDPDHEKLTETVIPGYDSWQNVVSSVSSTDELRDHLPKYTMYHAEERGFAKFGQSIASNVGDEYKEAILPKVGEVMQGIATDMDDESLRRVSVFKEPSPGDGERIFHVKMKLTIRILFVSMCAVIIHLKKVIGLIFTIT